MCSGVFLRRFWEESIQKPFLKKCFKIAPDHYSHIDDLFLSSYSESNNVYKYTVRPRDRLGLVKHISSSGTDVPSGNLFTELPCPQLKEAISYVYQAVRKLLIRLGTPSVYSGFTVTDHSSPQAITRLACPFGKSVQQLISARSAFSPFLGGMSNNTAGALQNVRTHRGRMGSPMPWRSWTSQ